MRKKHVIGVALLLAMVSTGQAHALQESGKLLAGVPANFPPHYFIDNTTGKPAGFAIDVMEGVARKAGLKVGYVVYPTWARTIEAIGKGEIDLIPNMGITAERKASMDFTSPVEIFDICIFVREDTVDIEGIEDLIGKEVAVVEQNKGQSLMEERGGSRLRVCGSTEEAFLSLISGKSDALVFPRPQVMHLSREAGLEDRIKTVGKPLLEVKRGIAVGKGNHELRKRLDDALNDFVKSSRYSEVHAKWHGKPEPYWTAKRLVVVGSGLLVFTFVTLLLRRNVSLLHLNEKLRVSVEGRRKAEEELREKTEELDRYFTNALDMFCIADADGYFRRVNKRWETTFGYRLEEMEGKRFLDFVHPEDMKATLEAVSRLDAQREVLNFVSRYRCKDGSYRWIEWNSTPSGNLIYAAARDITGRKNAEDALQASKTRLRQLIDGLGPHMFVGLLIPDGTVIEANRSALAAAGLRLEDVLGQSFEQTYWFAYSKAVQQQLREAVDRAAVGTPSRYDVQVRAAEGVFIWLDFSLYPLRDETGKVVFLVPSGIVITERKNAEDALRAIAADLERRVVERTSDLEETRDALMNLVEDLSGKTQELQKANVRLHEMDKLKSVFLATMSHELRTPLNSIIGFTGILLQKLAGPVNEEQVKQLGMVRNSAHHLLALINDVLDISKIEAGQLEIVREPFELPEMIESVRKTMAPQAERKGLALSADIEPGIGSLTSDRRRVEQILLNLVGNAVKFTESGQIQIECRVRDGRLVIRGADAGIGIRSEDMDKLFVPFRQIETGLDRPHDGTGLGLSICKKLAEMLGGEIRAESTWGAGSAFTFTLPTEGGSGGKDPGHRG